MKVPDSIAKKGVEETSELTTSQLLTKFRILLAIGRNLLGKDPFDQKIQSLISNLSRLLGNRPGITTWVEIDGKVFGEIPESIYGNLTVKDISVENLTRGRVCAKYGDDEKIFPEDEYFLQEVAELIGRKIEVHELDLMLRRSEERYRKLAANLSQEMWRRTEALASQSGYLEGILRSSADMIMTTDLDSKIVEFNPAAEKLLGYTAEEIQGHNINEVWLNASERDEILEEVKNSGGIKNHKTKLRTKDGDIIEIALTLSLLKDNEGRILGTVGISRDIAQDNAIRRELERLNKNYREAIHFINHENKNSLLVIGGFVRRLLDSETDPKRREQLEIVYHHSTFLEAMSRDFLTMADLEQGEFQIRKEEIGNFSEQIIFPAMVGLKERYPNSFDSYDESMGGVGSIPVYGDPRFLEIVYRNLFGNALKYGFPGPRIAYGVVDLGDKFLFNVWNAGPGIDPEEREKIFEKFYRIPNEMTHAKRGTGLGLYNIKRIIEAHGGNIWCESEVGRWVNFLFTLPKN
ncbi:MAG: PAS domain-containing sensor histidine kinase [Deltaproteobacteria bacterium]|nr:PAS domain-containing sensor histidine kinase [Deltaproteobacteria bacterium]